MTNLDNRIWSNVAPKDADISLCSKEQMQESIARHVDPEWYERIKTNIGIGIAMGVPYSKVNLDFGKYIQVEKADSDNIIFKLFTGAYNVGYVCIMANEELKKMIKSLKSPKKLYAIQ